MAPQQFPPTSAKDATRIRFRRERHVPDNEIDHRLVFGIVGHQDPR
jgi:hypothetical protein